MLDSSDALTVRSPLSGQVYPIEQVPDPVFSQRMAGDGLSVDPTSDTLVAPVDGTVTYIHPSLHALTIKSGDYEVLMHIGLETVALKGEGFKQLVQQGAEVRCGDPLVQFDMDLIASKAKSLVTVVLVTGGKSVKILTQSQCVSAGTELFVATDPGTSSNRAAVSDDGNFKPYPSAKIQNPTGIHARPAASMISELKKLTAEVKLSKGGQTANAKSIIALIALELNNGDECSIEASGQDAEKAAGIVKEVLERIHDDGSEHAPASEVRQKIDDSDDPNLFLGAGISAGAVWGKVLRLNIEDVQVAEKGEGVEVEEGRLEQALAAAESDIESLQKKLQLKGQKNRAAIFAAHLEILRDPDILQDAADSIKKGCSAGFSWRESYRGREQALLKLNNELLAARANDLRDVGRRVLNLLTDQDSAKWDIPENTIIVAEDLTPSDVVGLDTNLVAGFVTIAGGPTSHVAILAKSLNIPAVSGVRDSILNIPAGIEAILDGGKGSVALNPSAEDVLEVKERQLKREQQHKEALSRAAQPALCRDGTRFEVCANIGSLNDSQEGVRLGAEGVGLLRSEFLFLHRETQPSVEDQVKIYEDIAESLGGRRLVIRTLDVGGDKPLPYLNFPDEENPFLGVRGVRIHRDNPRIITEQVEAICRAAQKYDIAMMFPMISFLHEIKQFKSLVREICEKHDFKMPQVGIMVEVPSAALQAEVLAEEADFFSIGTNDLAQYTLATDRTHRELAKTVDGLHPSVLRLIAMATEGAKKHGKHVAVCGGIASDLDAVPILMGLGIHEFSVSLPMIAEVKDEVRKYAQKDCQELGQKVLRLGHSGDVRKNAQEFRGL